MTTPNISDQYRQLFGRSGTNKGTDIDMAEHGRVGGVSTGEPYKKVGIVDGLPTDSGKNNSSLEITYDANGNPIYLDETIGSDIYRTTLTVTGGLITNISAAIKQ
jgi:hypothetical protein